jgi:hypothetical protein
VKGCTRGARGCLFDEKLEKFSGAINWYAVVNDHVQQIVVSGNNEVSFSRDSQGKKLIILWDRGKR